MKLELEYDQIELKFERNYMLFSTVGGRLLCLFIIFSISLLPYYFFIEMSVDANLVFFDHLVIILKSIFVGFLLVCFGYFYNNYGGHVSNVFTSTTRRTFEFDCDKKVLIITESGREQAYDFSTVSIFCKANKNFLIVAGKGFYMPPKVFTEKVISNLNGMLIK